MRRSGRGRLRRSRRGRRRCRRRETDEVIDLPVNILDPRRLRRRRRRTLLYRLFQHVYKGCAELHRRGRRNERGDTATDKYMLAHLVHVSVGDAITVRPFFVLINYAWLCLAVFKKSALEPRFRSLRVPIRPSYSLGNDIEVRCDYFSSQREIIFFSNSISSHLFS